MNQTAVNAVNGIDVVIFVIDCTKKLIEAEETTLKQLEKNRTPVILALNKIDLLPDREKLLEIIEKFTSVQLFSAVVPVNAKKEDGVDRVLQEVGKFAVTSPFHFPADKLTDQSEQHIASEIIRSQLLTQLNDEVPHGIAIGIDEFREIKECLHIIATIYTERQSHKGIIIGKGGAKLKSIGTSARIALEDFFRIKVNVKLWVKVRENWRNNENNIKDFGLLFDDKR
jgi:GTP-binding protein Era